MGMYICVCMCILVYTHNVCLGVCKSMYVYVLVCAWVFMSLYYVCSVVCYSVSDPLVRSKPGNRRPGPNSDLCSLWIRYTGDSKTGAQDDSEIPTSSYSEDQKTIRIQNRVISCECLLLYHFLIYHCQFIYIYMLLISFHLTVWHIWPVWLSVLFHMTSVTVHLIYLVDFERLSASVHASVFSIETSQTVTCFNLQIDWSNAYLRTNSTTHV